MTGKTRLQLLLNNNWVFQYGAIEEAKYTDYDDSHWYHIGLPHSFGIPYFMENHFYVGYGSYRKTLDIPTQWLSKKLYLEFQGVFQETEVYVNGNLAGTHKGGYTAFIIDITDFLTAGKNQLFVKVNNLWNPCLAPRAGEHVFNGGIYRDVSLIVTEQVHIAWYGTFVKTPQVSEESASLQFTTELENHTGSIQEATLLSTVEYQGQIIFTTSSRCTINPGATLEVTQNGAIKDPKLWHPDTPELYVLKSLLYTYNLLCDEYETDFGVRWFTFTSQEGFFLNGKSYPIIGANVHQDHAGWGDAVTHAGIRRDVRLIKDCGMNFIRGSHYPHHTKFAEECDRQGILFWSELCFWGIGGCREDGYWNSSAYPVNSKDRQEFEESCRLALKEMIRTNRNHPSIIVWSMGNEVFFSKPEVINQAQILVKRLVSLSHELDPTRPAASGGAQRAGFDLLGDIAGYNGDGASLYIDPGFPNFVSEYGSSISDRPGEFSPHFTDGVEKDYSWRCGKAIWCGFHHGSIADQMGHMGMIDYYRLPLLSWYWYRENLLGISPPALPEVGTPYALKLTADLHTFRTDGTEDTHIQVIVVDESGKRLSNSLPVTLRVEKGGGLFPTGKTITLSPEKGSLLEGLGAIEMRAFYAGQIMISATAEGLQGDSLTLTATGQEEWTEQKLNFQAGPPEVYIPGQAKEKINIAQDRPVFCSSFSPNHLSKNINDGSRDTSWRPAGNEKGEWVMQDLEGCKSIKEIIVTFKNKESNRVEIYISEDNNSFELLAGEQISDSKSSINLNFQPRSVRFIKIYFPEASSDIVGLEVYTP